MRIVLYILLGLLGLLIILLLIALLRTLLTPAKISVWQPKRDAAREEKYAETLSRMVQYETVSAKGEIFRDKFLGFHELLEQLFPLVHTKLEKTEIDGSLLFYWKGKSAEKPLVLMGHQDVVPAEGVWEHGPFSGDIEHGRIWGAAARMIKARSCPSSRRPKNCWQRDTCRSRMCIWPLPIPKKSAATAPRSLWRS